MVFAALTISGMTAIRAAGQGLLAFNPTSTSFGDVTAGSSKTVTVTITNEGRAAVTISSVPESGSGFSVSGLSAGKTINPGTSVTATLKFAPTRSGSFSGYEAITSNATNSTVNYSMSGTGIAASSGTLTATPASASFGTLALGTTNSQMIGLTNTGSSSLTITSGTVTGNGFGLSGIAFPTTLAAGQSTKVTLTYHPTVSGYVAGSVTFASNASNRTLTLTMSGTGAGGTRTLTATPAHLWFGNENVGSSNTMAITLTNTGNSGVTISGITSNMKGTLIGGGVAGATIAAGQSTTLNVTFAPTSAGSVSGNLSVASNATNSPNIFPMSGDGISSSSHSVALSWNASTSSGIVGYYVYRAIGSGGYTRLTGSLVNTLKYTDTAVSAGTTYKYAVTALDSAGTESGYSGAISATVP
jgi:HYDIN/CFA65/VesB-like, Ig-like domain